MILKIELDYSKEDIRECLKMISKALEQPQKSGWIPVTERLPEKYDDVLVCDLNGSDLRGIYVGFRDENNIWRFSCCGDAIENVIAWTPLPEPYKTEPDLIGSCKESEDK